MISSTSGESGRPCGSVTSTGCPHIPQVSSLARTRLRSSRRRCPFALRGLGLFAMLPSLTVALYTASMYRVYVLGLLLLAGCSSTPATPVSEPPVPVEEDYSALAVEFAGTTSVVVGEDIQPGTYEEETPTGKCKWFKGVDGKLTNSGDGPLMVAQVGETIEVEGCSVVVRIGELSD